MLIFFRYSAQMPRYQRLKFWKFFAKNSSFFGNASLHPISDLALKITTFFAFMVFSLLGGHPRNYRQSTEKWRVSGVGPKGKEGGNVIISSAR
jgi:hypothetical protein